MFKIAKGFSAKTLRPRGDILQLRRSFIVMRYVFLLSVICLLSPLQPLAAEAVAPDLSELTPLQRFAVDGLGTGAILLGPAIDTVLAKLGLPERIEIRKEGARWDIDLEQTPVDWIYRGFIVTALFYRDGLIRNKDTGKYEKGPYRDSRTVDSLRVTSPDVKLIFGLGVGSTVDDFAKVLGEPRPRRVTSISGMKMYGYYYYDVPVRELVGRNVDIWLKVDSADRVTEIMWSRAAWH